MKKFLLIAATLFAAISASLAMTPSASAYPELTCNLTVEPQVVYEGQTLTATGTAVEIEKALRASALGDNISWVMTFNGETRTGTGAVFVQKFKAPSVTQSTKFLLTAKANSAAGTCPHTISITVLPNGVVVTPPEGQGGLPNTGGPRLLILLAGLALVVGGVVAVKRARSDA